MCSSDEFTIEDLRTVAPHLAESLDRYRDSRVETGGFLRKCLENDLIGAVGKADHSNRRRIVEIACYIYNKLPVGSWGSKEAVDKWLSGHKQ